jgi:hypothetical protein
MLYDAGVDFERFGLGLLRVDNTMVFVFGVDADVTVNDGHITGPDWIFFFVVVIFEAVLVRI